MTVLFGGKQEQGCRLISASYVPTRIGIILRDGLPIIKTCNEPGKGGGGAQVQVNTKVYS